MKLLLILLFCLWTLIKISHATSTPAHVEIEKKSETVYNARVRVHNRLHNLQLTKPEKSIFTENFSFIMAKKGPTGQTVFQPVTPSTEIIKRSQENLHVDTNARAALRVRKSPDGQIKLHGIIDGVHITHNGEGHVTTNLHQGSNSNRRVVDYVETNVTLTYPPGWNPSNGQETELTIIDSEIFLVLDNKQWTNLGDDHEVAMEYVAILIHGVNAFYQYSEDPKITYKIVGLLTMNTTEQQPFMDSARILKDADSAYDMRRTLAGFASYMYKNRDILPPHDVAAFISGEEFKTYNESTEVWDKGIVGLAHRKAACSINVESEKSFKTSVVKDMGAFWRGTYPLVHELAHVLGAAHDGDAGAEDCPWNEGNIMSYTGWGSSKRFHFSSCSNELMKLYIKSNQGECLRSAQAKGNWNETEVYSGDKLTMDQLCQKLNGGKQNYRASSTKTLTELCRQIYCERCFKTFFGEVCGLTGSEPFDLMPGENTPCGKDGGKCLEGECIGVD